MPTGIKLGRAANDPDIVFFYCPGCDQPHVVHVNGKRNSCNASWTWNGSMEKPTFQPSIHVVGICHSWVTDGRINFLGDSAHALKGQTVDLPDWDSM